MLNDIHIATLHDFLNPEQVFPDTNIRGGLCYFLWDSSYDNIASQTKVYSHQLGMEPTLSLRNLKTENEDIFIRHSLAISIVDKVKKHINFESFEKNVSARKPFGIVANIVKQKNLFRETKNQLLKPVICFGKGRQVGYMEYSEIQKNIEWISKYKVFTPRANNIGTELNDDNLNTFIGEPNSICTESYIVLGINLNLDLYSSNNLCKYFSTKFVRFMHSLSKASQDATSKTYKFVPLQDFSKKSDINWNMLNYEIDKVLYKKYNLTKDEISFIENMIKPMI